MAFQPKPLDQTQYAITIIKDLGMQPTPSGIRKARFALVECSSCHNHFKLRMGSTKAKQQTKCSTCTFTKHGTCKDPLYAIWNGIKQRCYATSRKDYSKYGGKGVTMCNEWKNDPQAFITWCKSNGWTKDKVIDKDIKCRELGITPAIYSPETITFVTTQENAEEANAKQVKQFTKDGDYLATYDSCTKAALSIGKPKTAKSNIANCCRGVNHTAFGYVWKFV